jgi:hypothetical protein
VAETESHMPFVELSYDEGDVRINVVALEREHPDS